MVVEPFKNPERFTSIGVAPPKGILLYGPSGVGKTELALAAAKASGSNVIAISVRQARIVFHFNSKTCIDGLLVFNRERTFRQSLLERASAPFTICSPRPALQAPLF
jgi:AAA+ superfamily predicted ATPase